MVFVENSFFFQNLGQNRQKSGWSENEAKNDSFFFLQIFQ